MTTHLLSQNCIIYMRLEWKLEKISACFDSFNKFFSWIWDRCVDGIFSTLGSFTYIGFSDRSL